MCVITEAKKLGVFADIMDKARSLLLVCPFGPRAAEKGSRGARRRPWGWPGARPRGSELPSEVLRDVEAAAFVAPRAAKGVALEALALRSQRHAFLDAPQGRPLAFEEAVEKAEEARAVTSLAAAELRKVLQESNQASEDALAAAQVAVVTEAVAFIGRPAEPRIL